MAYEPSLPLPSLEPSPELEAQPLGFGPRARRHIAVRYPQKPEDPNLPFSLRRIRSLLATLRELPPERRPTCNEAWELADTLRELRLGLGLTQRDLAHECGLHRLVVSYWERATRTPQDETLNRMLGFFYREYEAIAKRKAARQTAASFKDLSLPIGS
jgi:DNA-binding XRE family transcriptional regulator